MRARAPQLALSAPMSAYLEWLQKQEHKVRRSVKASSATTSSSSTSSGTSSTAPVALPFTRAASSLLSSAAVDVDLAAESEAYRAWRQRREATQPTIETELVDNELPLPSGKRAKTTTVGKDSMTSTIVSADSRERPLSVAVSSVSSTAAARTQPRVLHTTSKETRATGAANAKKIGAAVSRGFVSVRTLSSSSSSGSNHSRSSSAERSVTTHARKRGIDDVEAPSKQASLPSKQQKVDARVPTASKEQVAPHRADGHRHSLDSSSEKDDDNINDDEDAVSKPKKRTPLDEALAKIDAIYGSLVPLDVLHASISRSAYLPDRRAGIQEAHFWSDVDRFASL